MPEKVIYWVGASLISAFLYRLGGTKAGTKWRDIGVPIVATVYMLTLGVKFVWWAYLLNFLLLFGALTTYWDRFYGYDNYWFSGFMVGLASFPLYWAGIHWYSIIIRAMALTILWGWWCKIFGNDWVEELGRGAFIIMTLPILLI